MRKSVLYASLVALLYGLPVLASAGLSSSTLYRFPAETVEMKDGCPVFTLDTKLIKYIKAKKPPLLRGSIILSGESFKIDIQPSNFYKINVFSQPSFVENIEKLKNLKVCEYLYKFPEHQIYSILLENSHKQREEGLRNLNEYFRQAAQIAKNLNLTKDELYKLYLSVTDPIMGIK